MVEASAILYWELWPTTIDKLFTERATEIREICMKERAGNCEHRKLYHDLPLCALPQQTGSQ